MAFRSSVRRDYSDVFGQNIELVFDANIPVLIILIPAVQLRYRTLLHVTLSDLRF